MRDYHVYLQDIRDNLQDIQRFVDGFDFGLFARDKKTQNAVIRSFEVVGEAAKNVPAEIQNKYPDVPWRILAGFRDRLIHAYFDVNLEIVWESVQQISDLLKKLENI